MEPKQPDQYANMIPMAELDTKEKRLHPFDIYNQLRQSSPIRYDEGRRCWDVFRYDDIQRILKDPAVFSSNRDITGKGVESLLTMDPPRHTQMRALVNKAFTPKVLSDLEPHIAAITSELLDAVRGNKQMDIVHDLAVPLPVIVIAELLGVPAEDRKLFKEWSDVLVKGSEENTKEAVSRILTEKEQTLGELFAYFKGIIEKRRKETKEDLISLLLQAEIEGQKLNEQEILAFSILLLAAGNETTTNLITNAVRRLTEDQSLLEQLKQAPEHVPSFIEEVLRFYPPIQAVGRAAVSDVEIGGKLIKAGDQVVSWVASANRDEAVFEDPDRFMIDRKPNNHVSFGFGIHFCLGAPLARLESRIALRTLVERTSTIRLVTGTELTVIPSPFVYGVKQLPVTLT